MVNVEVIWTVGGVTQDLVIFSSELVSSEDGFQVPVSPVNVVIHQGDGKHVGNKFLSRKNSFDITSIKVCIGNVVQMGISPPDLVGEIVNSDCIWPGQLVTIDSGDDHLKV